MPTQTAGSDSTPAQQAPPAVWVGMPEENPFPDPIPAIRWLDPSVSEDLDKALDPADLTPLPEELEDFDPASHSARVYAREWLLHYLSNGPKPVPEILRNAYAHGHSTRTIHRAKELLNVRSIKPGKFESWCWSLPNTPDSLPTSDTLDCQPPAHEKSDLATFSQNAENEDPLEILSDEPQVKLPPEPNP